MAINFNTPLPAPRGWGKVQEGSVQVGDKIWTPETGKYEPASYTELGTQVTCWKAVIREGYRPKLNGRMRHRLIMK